MSNVHEMPPQKPFSTILAMKIMSLIHDRDLELLELRGRFQTGQLTGAQLTAALEASESKIADDVLAACANVLKTLEATVASVLSIQAQMNQLRAMAAEDIKPPGTMP